MLGFLFVLLLFAHFFLYWVQFLIQPKGCKDYVSRPFLLTSSGLLIQLQPQLWHFCLQHGVHSVKNQQFC